MDHTHAQGCGLSLWGFPAIVTYLQRCSRKPGHCSLQELQGWPRSGSSASGGCSRRVKDRRGIYGQAPGRGGKSQHPPLHSRARARVHTPGPVLLGHRWAGWDSTQSSRKGNITEIEEGQLRPPPSKPPFEGLPLLRSASNPQPPPPPQPGSPSAKPLILPGL